MSALIRIRFGSPLKGDMFQVGYLCPVSSKGLLNYDLVNFYWGFVCLTESYMYVNEVNICYLLMSVSPLWVYKQIVL